jgi:hypothetical protein
MLWGAKHEWHWYSPWPWQTLRSVDGTVICGPAMRRIVNGTTQYRPMTAEESEDNQNKLAW